MVFQGQGVSRKFQECFETVSRVFQERFKDAERIFQGCFKGVLGGFKLGLEDI